LFQSNISFSLSAEVTSKILSNCLS